MATIIRKKGLPSITDNDEVKKYLADFNVEYNHWPVPSAAHSLTSKEVLTDAEKEDLLSKVNDRFEFLKGKHGYQSRDLVVLHKNVPGIDDMLAKFDKVHYHSDEEVRYIIDGSGYFGFITPKEKFLVHVTASDYVFVPAGVHHWFYLDDSKRIKAVRYFRDMAGWTPHYVDAKADIEI